MPDAEKTLDERIRERAYDLWEQGGRSDGDADHYWEQARREVEGGGATVAEPLEAEIEPHQNDDLA